MKKMLYVLLISLFSINVVKAFDIDINKIDISSKSNELVNSLNKTYNIEVNGFDKKIIYDKDVANLTKDVVRLTLSDKEIDEKLIEYNQKYLFVSSSNGSETLSGSLFARMFLGEITEKKIKADYIKEIKTVAINENDVLSFVYLPGANIDGKKQDLILAYWLKKENNVYKVYFPWLTTADSLENYFNQVTLKEENGSIFGGTYNKLSLGDNVNNTNQVDNTILEEIYNKNRNSNVQVIGMNDSGTNIYGSGFVIREGVIATTWSNFLKFLTDSNYIYITDSNGVSYNISGVIAAQIDYDIVLLKLDKEVLPSVTFGNVNNMRTNDNLFMINSKANGNFSISYGSFISVDNGRIKNLFALNSGDVGGALYNSNGEVIGFSVGDTINSDLSYANSTEYLWDIQNILKNKTFAEITSVNLDDFKFSYYDNVLNEKTYDDTGKEANKYKEVGDVIKAIDLPLIKASFKDKILSLRYKNETGGMLDSLYLVSNYAKILENEGYKKTYDKNNKLIYVGDKYKVIIKNNLNYLIILIMEK